MYPVVNSPRMGICGMMENWMYLDLIQKFSSKYRLVKVMAKSSGIIQKLTIELNKLGINSDSP